MQFTLKDQSEAKCREALGQCQRSPYGNPVLTYPPLPGYSAAGGAISFGHGVSRAQGQGTMPCVGRGSALLPVVFAKSRIDKRGRAVVAVYRREGEWQFPNPEAYGAHLADERQLELLTRIANPPHYLDFTGLKSFRDKVLPQPELAGTHDFMVRRALLHQLQVRNLIEVYDAENPQGLPYPVKALRLTPMGWKALDPAGEAA